MSRLPRITGEEVVRALGRAGFTVAHIRGSHHYLRRENASALVTVPVHSGKTIPLKTLKNILKQAQVTVQEFIELL